jgi:pilus assembly protein CpaB
MQKNRAQLLLGLALFLGIAAVFLMRQFLATQVPAESPIETAYVVTAKTDLPVGTALSDSQFEKVAWPKSHLPSGVVMDERLVRTRILRRPLAAGEPVLESALLPEGSEAGLTSVIDPTFRAVSVKVDSVIGVAGFVKPGRKVDVLVTLRKVDDAKPLPYSKVVLQNVQVLAVDQQMQEAKDGEPEIVSVVTLAVGPNDSQKLIYAAHEGKLQLALRNPTDDEVRETRRVGVNDLLGFPRPKKAAKKRSYSGVQILKGTTATNKVF